MAILDGYSRYVLAWELSITLEVDFCSAALQKALAQSQPLIFNSDQGPPFTSEVFTPQLLKLKILVSMDGKGSAFDNIFVERLWRTVQYEEVFLKDYRTVADARSGLGRYFEFYNQQRLHPSLNYKTPQSVYFDKAHQFVRPT